MSRLANTALYLVPVDTTRIKCLYIFVEITIDQQHLARTIHYHFSQEGARKLLHDVSNPQVTPETTEENPGIVIEYEAASNSKESDKPTKVAVVGTVQFIAAVQSLSDDIGSLKQSQNNMIEDGQKSSNNLEIVVPQIKPLSPGEILGCTAPKLAQDINAIL